MNQNIADGPSTRSGTYRILIFTLAALSLATLIVFALTALFPRVNASFFVAGIVGILLLLALYYFFNKQNNGSVGKIITQLEDTYQQEISLREERIKEQAKELEATSSRLEEARRTIDRNSKDLKVMNQVLDLKVEQRTRDLEQANLDLSTFLYRSSHDIMGPMATLTGLCNVAKIEIQDPVSLQYLDKITTTAGKMNRIIRNLNDVFELRNRELFIEKAKLLTLCQEVVEEGFDAFALKNMELLYDIEANLEVSTDMDLLKSVLFELIKNAISYRSSATEHHNFIKISARKRNKNTTQIQVADNGAGIQTETVKKIRAMLSHSTEVTKVVGLGLFIAKTKANRIKGTLELISDGNADVTTFQVTIPQLKPEV